MRRPIREFNFMAVLLLTAGFSLSGCSSKQDIQQWIDQQRETIVPRITPLAKPVLFVPAAYVQSAVPDPFESDRLTKALKAQNPGNDTLLQIELNRRKEPLEAFALDSMAMVGSIDQKGQQIALIRTNNLVYQVRVGNYLGQSYGKVTKITESAIELREIVQDSSGEWIERNTTLQLQQSQEKSQ
jgi:type IV pilus assembly protein PilP